MTRTELLWGAYVGDAACFGTHWMYDIDIAHQMTENIDHLFMEIDKGVYEGVTDAYFPGENKVVGNTAFPGDLLYVIDQYIRNDKDPNALGLTKVSYEWLKPGSPYVGYVESYANHLVSRVIQNIMNKEEIEPYTTLEDNHLTMFLPLFVLYNGKETDLDKVKELTKVYTVHPDVPDLIDFMHYVLCELESGKGRKIVLRESIEMAPLHYQELLKLSLKYQDPLELAIKTNGTSCVIDKSLHLIWNICYQAGSLEQALKLNMYTTGATSSRGQIIGALYGVSSSVPDELKNKLKIGSI